MELTQQLQLLQQMKQWLSRHFKRHAEKITQSQTQFFVKYIDQPYLWSTKETPLARATALGLFVGMLPLPGHMIMAGLLAIFFRANLPVAVLMVWASNPITLAPITFLEYKIGVTILHSPNYKFSFEPTWYWVTHHFIHLWKPLALGTLIFATLMALLGYGTVKMFSRTYFFIHVRKKLHRLKQQTKRAIK
jgi:uncharacterized protein (DUF2062 family)